MYACARLARPDVRDVTARRRYIAALRPIVTRGEIVDRRDGEAAATNENVAKTGVDEKRGGDPDGSVTTTSGAARPRWSDSERERARGSAPVCVSRYFITDVTSRRAECAPHRRRERRRKTLKRDGTDGRERRHACLTARANEPAVGTTRETTDDSPSCNDWRGRTANDNPARGGEGDAYAPLGGSAVLSRDSAPLLRGSGGRRKRGLVENTRGRPSVTEAPRSRFNIKCTTLRGRMSRARRRTDGRIYRALRRERRGAAEAVREFSAR